MLNTSKVFNTTTPNGLTAIAGHIAYGKTAYVNGVQVTGTLGEIVYSSHGSAPDISYPATEGTSVYGTRCSANVGEYVLFDTAVAGTPYTPHMDAYDTSLVKSSAPGFSTIRRLTMRSKTTDYAIFAGGILSSGGGTTYTVDAYNSDLTITTASSLSFPASSGAGTYISEYAIISSGSEDYNLAQAYDNSLTRHNLAFSCGRWYAGAGSNEYYAVILCGSHGAGYDGYLDAYSTDLTRTASSVASGLRGTKKKSGVTGEYILFFGGEYSSSLTTTTFSCDRSLVCQAQTNIRVACVPAVAETNDNIIVVHMKGLDTVDVYSSEMVRSNGENITTIKYSAVSGTIGSYAIFAGGYNETTNYLSAEFYSYSPMIHIPAQTITF